MKPKTKWIITTLVILFLILVINLVIGVEKNNCITYSSPNNLTSIEFCDEDYAFYIITNNETCTFLNYQNITLEICD